MITIYEQKFMESISSLNNLNTVYLETRELAKKIYSSSHILGSDYTDKINETISLFKDMINNYIILKSRFITYKTLCANNDLNLNPEVFIDACETMIADADLLISELTKKL